MTKDFLMGEDVNSPFGDHFDEMVRPDLNDEQFDEIIDEKIKNNGYRGGLRRGKFYMIEALVPPHHGRFHVKHHLLAKAIHNQVLDLEVGQRKKGFKINLKSPYLYGTSARVATIGHLPVFRAHWPEEVFRQLKRDESPFVECKDNSYYVAGKEILRFINFYDNKNIQRVTHVPASVLGYHYMGSGRYSTTWSLDKSHWDYLTVNNSSFDYTKQREDWVEVAIERVIYLRLYGDDRQYWSERLGLYIQVSFTNGDTGISLYGADRKVKFEKEKARKRLHDIENPKRK